MTTPAFRAFALLATAAYLFSNATLAAENDETGLRAIPETIVQGWNSGKGNIVASVYADDGTLVAGHGVVTRGRSAIARYHDELFSGPNAGTRLIVKVSSVRFLSDDVALVQTEGGILWPGESELAPRNRGIQSFVVKKNAGAWQVVLFQNTRILASTSSAPASG